MAQPLGGEPPEKATVDALLRADVVLLAVEFVQLLLLVLGLVTSTASHAQAAQLLLGGPYTLAFWGAIVAAGILVPIVLQSLELSHRIPHTIVPALLVLAGGLRAALGDGQRRPALRGRAGLGALAVRTLFHLRRRRAP